MRHMLVAYLHDRAVRLIFDLRVIAFDLFNQKSFSMFVYSSKNNQEFVPFLIMFMLTHIHFLSYSHVIFCLFLGWADVLTTPLVLPRSAIL